MGTLRSRPHSSSATRSAGRDRKPERTALHPGGRRDGVHFRRGDEELERCGRVVDGDQRRRRAFVFKARDNLRLLGARVDEVGRIAVVVVESVRFRGRRRCGGRLLAAFRSRAPPCMEARGVMVDGRGIVAWT